MMNPAFLFPDWTSQHYQGIIYDKDVTTQLLTMTEKVISFSGLKDESCFSISGLDQSNRI